MKRIVFWVPPPSWWTQFAQCIPKSQRPDPEHSELNGSNGEWTNTDDIDRRRQNQLALDRPRRLANRMNEGCARRGGNQYGPPVGARPIHPDNHANLPGAARGEQSAVLQFHANGYGAGIAGDLAARVASDSLVPTGGARRAARRYAEYTARKLEREKEIACESKPTLDLLADHELERELRGSQLRNAARLDQRRAEHQLDQELRHADLQVGGEAEIIRAENLERATTAAANIAIADAPIRAEAATAAANAKLACDLTARRAIRNQELRLAREEQRVAEQERLQMTIEQAQTDLAILQDPVIRELGDARVAAEAAAYRRRMRDLMSVAQAEYDLAQVKEGGRVRDRELFDAPPVFIRNERWNPAFHGKQPIYPWINPDTREHPNFPQIDVPLVMGALLTRHRKATWSQYLLGGMAWGWKKMVARRLPDGTLGHANIAPSNALVLFDDGGTYHGDLNLLKSDDRRICRTILNDYRILGLECGFLQAVLTGGEGFILENAFTSIQPVMVHPTLYKLVTQEATGVSITKNQASALVRKFRDPWLRYVQPALFHDTVNLACQHAEIYNHQRARTIAKPADVLGDL